MPTNNDLEQLTPEQIKEYCLQARVDPDKDYIWRLLDEKITFPEYGKHCKERCLYTCTEIAIGIGLVPDDIEDCTYLQRIRIKIR